MRKVKDFLSRQINSICEVRDMENELLMTGRIYKVLEVDSNAEEGRLAVEITALERNSLPYAAYDLPVKINLFGSDGGHHTVGGHVYIANEVFWRINKVSKLSDFEKRDFFRIRVAATGKACSQRDMNPEEEPVPVPIKILDISLSGILFRTKRSFQINDRLYIFDIRLCNDAPEFSTFCTVRRIENGPEDEVLYGCSFEDLSEKEEDSLFSTIFNLHRLEIRKRKKRL